WPATLGRMGRLGPGLAPALDHAQPDSVEVDDLAVLTLLRDRLGPLEDADIGVLLPSWWTQRPRIGLRAKVRSASGESGGFQLGNVFDFTWEAALGDRRLTKADLAT